MSEWKETKCGKLGTVICNYLRNCPSRQTVREIVRRLEIDPDFLRDLLIILAYYDPCPNKLLETALVATVDSVVLPFNYDCGICHKLFCLNEKIKLLLCNHYFHIECLEAACKDLCPTCETKIDSNPICLANDGITREEVYEILRTAVEKFHPRFAGAFRYPKRRCGDTNSVSQNEDFVDQIYNPD